MKDKKLEKLNNELADDEFERLLQEYLDESLDSDDTLDETENLDDDTDEKKLRFAKTVTRLATVMVPLPSVLLQTMRCCPILTASNATSIQRTIT